MTDPRLVCVVGPSGAGKDSLLAWLKAHWRGPGAVQLARRTITRPVQAGGEPHESVTTAEFVDLLKKDQFVLHWSAHGLMYGIRRGEMQSTSEQDLLFVNGSRAHLATMLEQYPAVRVLHITAPPEVLQQRLLARGREGTSEVAARVGRSPGLPTLPEKQWCEVSNHGTLEDAGQRVVRWLMGSADHPTT